MLKSTQELEFENSLKLKKKKEERTKFLDNLNDCLNNKKGKELLEHLYNLFNAPTDMNNPNNNYFRDGKLFSITYLQDNIKKINEKGK